MVENLSRNCPKCNTTIVYKSKKYLNQCIKKNSTCIQCRHNSKIKYNEWRRICPQCHIDIVYNRLSSYCCAKKLNSNCIKCRNSNRIGSGNGFYGKHHSNEVKEATSIRTKNNKTFQSQEFKDKISKVSKARGFLGGRSSYQILIDTYGKEEADIRYQNTINKWKISSSGSNNTMYGKPSPKKCGNGWSGWYKGKFFRSLRELSYIVNVLEPSGKEWKSAENIRIPYKNYDGSDRTYSPDFICDGELIEIKPQRLINTPLVKLKSDAATQYCNENNLKFSILDIEVIDMQVLDNLINNRSLILTERTTDKYNEYRKI